MGEKQDLALCDCVLEYQNLVTVVDALDCPIHHIPFLHSDDSTSHYLRLHIIAISKG